MDGARRHRIDDEDVNIPKCVPYRCTPQAFRDKCAHDRLGHFEMVQNRALSAL